VIRRGGETRYEVAGDTASSAASAPVPAARVAADSLYAGIDEDVAEFYRQRTAVLAIA
jgi:hypothetical protein